MAGINVFLFNRSDSPGHSELPNLGSELNGALAETIQKALSWHIVPPDHPPFPSAVYGATHLARLFGMLFFFLYPYIFLLYRLMVYY